MNLGQLRTFVTAAECESFTRAALAMAVTQPAVSQQVAMLEKELGVSLFNRRGRTITLTNAGRHFYRYSRKALDLLDKARCEVGHVKDTVLGNRAYRELYFFARVDSSRNPGSISTGIPTSPRVGQCF